MSQEWYYEDDGNREGPVSPATLKQLADAGTIRFDTLVWRHGMSQWAPAKVIKGLFAESQPAAPAPTPTPAGPPPYQPDPPSPPPAAHGWHPFDLAIDVVRDVYPANLAATLSRLAGHAGTYLLYVAAVLLPVAGLSISTRTGAFRLISVAIALGISLIALQYVSARLLGACEVAIRVNRSVLPSLVIPDCVFVLCVVGTVLGVMTLIGVAIVEGTLTHCLFALALLIIGGFTALVALDPVGINVFVDPECRAGQEAVGVLTFLVKVFLRCAPIAFAVAVAYATLSLCFLLFAVLQASGDAELFFIADAGARQTVTALFSAAAIPVYAYVALLAYFLLLDILSAIVSIPRKLDAIAEVSRMDTGNGQSRS